MSSLARLTPVVVFVSFLGKLWRQRHLILNFAIRDLRSRYVGSLMGLFWSVLHPLALLLCYSFVFTIIFEIRVSSLKTDNFAIFLFTGILPWLYFQDTVLRCCNSVVENSNLIRRTLFPSEILPISVALSNVATHLLGLVILLIVLAVAGLLGWTLVFLPVYLGLLVLLSLGLGWLVAALQVFLRDTSQVMTVLMIVWFWFTPIFYTADLVPDRFRPFLLFNPLAYVVEGYRYALLEGQIPDPGHPLTLLVFAGLAFLVGGVVFRNTKREFIDVL